MKFFPEAAAVLAALLLLSNVFPALSVTAGQLPEEIITPDNARISDEISQELPTATPEEANVPSPGESALPFSAAIEYSPHGYQVRGTFTDFPADTVSVQPMYSLDGEHWQACQDNYWDLEGLGDESMLPYLQNQICLLCNDEPLKSYLAEKLDRFYLKLQLTEENGATFDTQEAVIERGGPRPVPEGIIPQARFTSSMTVRRPKPLRGTQGQYQLTVHPDATPEEIASLLPDTIPVNVQILPQNLEDMAEGAADCPVTWKPLSLPQLAPGACITIPDAAEALTIPAGTLLSTPMGIFQLKESPVFNTAFSSDEISLVLNVVAENENPTGALSKGKEGLSMSFYLKPTGAASIRAYVISEGETEWTELPELSLTESVNAQPATANSGYTLVLSNSQEPYRSYLAAQNAGEKPTPFFVGFKIEGGVYHGRELILPWPGTYELPPTLPDLKGSGGNEGNIGSGNKDNSTDEGQRPDLPQKPGNSTDGQQPDLPQKPENSTDEPQTDLPQNSETDTDGQQPDLPQKPENNILPEPDTDSGNTSEGKNQNGPNIREDIHIPDRLYASIQLPVTTLAAAEDRESEENMDDRESWLPAAPGENIGSQISEKSAGPENHSAEIGQTDTPAASSGQENIRVTEKPDRSTEPFRYRLLLPAVFLTCICIIAVFIRTAAVHDFGKITGNIRRILHRLLL